MRRGVAAAWGRAARGGRGGVPTARKGGATGSGGDLGEGRTVRQGRGGGGARGKEG